MPSGRKGCRRRLLMRMSDQGTQRFASFEEWNNYLAGCPDRRDDDTPVIAGQTGWPRRRASREELLALVARCQAEDAAELDFE
jgi:hypothetical protein